MSDANPYDQFDAPAAPSSNPYDQFDDNSKPAYSGAILPFSRYPDGSVGFDSNAGLVGDVKRAITGLPGLAHQAGAETASNTATSQTAGKSANLAMMATPGDMLTPGISGRAVQSTVEGPSTKELYDAAGAGYNSLRNLGVHYNLGHVGNMAQGTQDALGELGLSSEVAPQTHAILNKLGTPPEGAVSVPLTGLTNVRAVLGRIGQGANPVDRLASKKAISALDDFIQDPAPEAVMAGDASAAADALKTANGNYAAAKRSDKIEGKGDYAQFRADSANSGSNLDNQIRQQIRPLLDPRYPQRLSGFNPEEKQAIQGIVEGSGPRNFLRSTGNTLGGGGGLGRLATGAVGGNAGAAAGYLAAGPIGSAVGSTLGATVLPAVGAAARSGANSLANKSVEKTAGLMRERSPLFQERQSAAPFDVPANAPGMAAVRAAGQMPPDQSHQYAKGGSVKRPTHEFLVNRLMKLAEKAKREEKKITAPILNMPDDTVTAALAKAQEAI